ncbi:MAG: Ig-like domain-containing protein [Acidobacteriota bacterium]
MKLRAIGVFPCVLPLAASAVTIKNGPWVAHVDRAAAVLAWDTDLASGSVVNYGTTPSYGSQVVGPNATVSSSGWANHAVTVPGLLPDTKYYYQVVSGNASTPAGGPNYWFQTAVVENTSFRFVSLADSRNDSSAIELAFGLPANFIAIMGRIKNLNPPPRFLVFSGDPVYGDDDPTVLRQEWDIWKSTTDAVHRNVPIYMSPGNHESYHPGAEDMFRDVWEQPHGGGLTPLGNLPWNLDELAYSFDYGVVHFTSYDTNVDGDPLDYNAPPEETLWLAADLASPVPVHRVVFGHTEGANPCIFGLGASLEDTSQANYLDFYTAMANGGVDAYVCGHIHNWVGDLGIMGILEIMNGTCGSISSTSFCGTVADHFTVWDVSCGRMDGHVYDQNGTEITERGAPFFSVRTNTTPPETSVIAPPPGTNVCGAITLEASAAAHNCEQVARVEFTVDGALVGVVTASPWQMTWDSTTVADGNHAIGARAYDSTPPSGLFRDAAPVAIVVDNAAPCGGLPANIAAGPGGGSNNPNMVSVFNAGGALRATWIAYGGGKWGTNVTGAEIDSDGIEEAITGPGPGDVYGPHVRAFRRDGTPVAKISYYAYGTLKYGVNVSSGHVDADAWEEILTAPGPGAVFGPHVRGWNFDANALTPIAKISFFAFGTLRYGGNVDGGNVDGDAFHEILAGAGPGIVFPPQVRGFNYDGVSVSAIAKLNGILFPVTSYGLEVVTGDLDRDGFEEIVGAKGPGPGFDAEARGYDFDGSALAAIAGVDLRLHGRDPGRAARIEDLDSDGYDEISVGPGPSVASSAIVKGYNVDGGTAAPMPGTNFNAFTGLGYGVNVAAIEANYP